MKAFDYIFCGQMILHVVKFFQEAQIKF